ncbi:MAG: hypothetical protein EBZ78_03750 [Verrucomicrobia bacterium]|nr:hypothetical protein [Verrucomicrobiota bacterium]
MTDASSWDWALLVFALFAALVATYPAVENRSPVFVAVLLLDRARRRSLSIPMLAGELRKRVRGRQLVLLTVAGGYICKKRGKYCNTCKGRWIGLIFGRLQKILGLDGKTS